MQNNKSRHLEMFRSSACCKQTGANLRVQIEREWLRNLFAKTRNVWRLIVTIGQISTELIAPPTPAADLRLDRIERSSGANDRFRRAL